MKNTAIVISLLLMFWNTENFFDPFDDAASSGDDEFIPGGKKFWTWKKFEKKRDDIARVIIAAGEKYGKYPSLIGLCEVENRFVLHQLVNETPLARLGYSILHRDSPDPRGIDVALLYKPSEFKMLSVRYLSISIGGRGTRFVLCAKGLANGLDTLHLLINHWPSKIGGEKKSLPARMQVSNAVKSFTDSLFAAVPDAMIVVMGDFNDFSDSAPLRNLDKFVTLYASGGTHKYQGKWERLDQFFVSRQLIDRGNKWLFCTTGGMEIFRSGFLLEKDKLYLGEKLRKTLSGPKYEGGVSDHLPVLLPLFTTAVP